MSSAAVIAIYRFGRERLLKLSVTLQPNDRSQNYGRRKAIARGGRIDDVGQRFGRLRRRLWRLAAIGEY